MMNRNINDRLIELYKSNLPNLTSCAGSLINAHREDAIRLFATYSLPTLSDENYKYSDVSKWFSDAVNDDSHLVTDLGGAQLVEQSNGDVVIADINTFAAQYEDVFRNYYTKSVEDSSLMMLSRAFAAGGRVVYVPRRTVCKNVIKLEDKSCEGDVLLGRRTILIFEKDSLAKIHIEHNDKGVVNSVYELFLEAGANVEISEEYSGTQESVLVNTISANLMRDTFYKHISVNFSNGKSRINHSVTLADKGADATIYGAVMANGNAHIDNTTLMKHSVENCRSYESFKYVVGDQATSVFYGNVFVSAGANGTQAYQQNNNILTSDNANMYSKPNLEIYADDVKCSHGATVGQLDEQAIFYLRQRGIPIEEAKRLMLKGFLKDTVDKITTPEIVDKIGERFETI